MCECTVYYNQKQGEHGQPLLVSGTVSSWSAFCVSRPTGGFKGAGSPLRRFFFPFSFAVERKGAGCGPERPTKSWDMEPGRPRWHRLGSSEFLQKNRATSWAMPNLLTYSGAPL